METGKKTLLAMTLEELKAVVTALGMPAFTAKQVAQWLYQKHVRSIDEMTNRRQTERNCRLPTLWVAWHL